MSLQSARLPRLIDKTLELEAVVEKVKEEKVKEDVETKKEIKKLATRKK